MTCLFLLGILGQLVKTSVAVPSNSPRQAVACRGHTGCSKPDAFCLHLQPEKLRHSADMIASELPRQSIDNCPLALPPITVRLATKLVGLVNAWKSTEAKTNVSLNLTKPNRKPTLERRRPRPSCTWSVHRPRERDHTD